MGQLRSIAGSSKCCRAASEYYFREPTARLFPLFSFSITKPIFQCYVLIPYFRMPTFLMKS